MPPRRRPRASADLDPRRERSRVMDRVRVATRYHHQNEDQREGDAGCGRDDRCGPAPGLRHPPSMSDFCGGSSHRIERRVSWGSGRSSPLSTLLRHGLEPGLPVTATTLGIAASLSPEARMRSLEIGLVLPMEQSWTEGATPRWTEIRELAARAEEIGFDTVWVPVELLWRPADGEACGWWECVAMASAVAATTSRIKVGTWILSALHR